MRYFFTSVLILIITLSITSCRKEIPQLDQPENAILLSPSQRFEAFWNGMNNNYVFWDIDTTNWDLVYKQYKPLFAQLSNDAAGERKGYTYFKKMTSGLIDSHFMLTFNSPYLVDSLELYPSEDRKMIQPDFHEIMNPDHFYYTVFDNYFIDGGAGTGYLNDEYYMVVAGVIHPNTLYFYCNTFRLKQLFEQKEDTYAKRTLAFFFNQLKNMPNLKKVILDVRGNKGGNMEDLNFLLGSMIDKPLNIGYTRSKQGNGRLDYSPWTPALVSPNPNAVGIKVPIVVLADSRSMSMSETLAMSVKLLPNGHFIGERTWGALGPLTDNRNYNGGMFSTQYMKSVYTSSLMFKYQDGKIYEGIGFPPDLEVKYNKAAIAAGEDPQLDAALAFVP